MIRMVASALVDVFERCSLIPLRYCEKGVNAIGKLDEPSFKGSSLENKPPGGWDYCEYLYNLSYMAYKTINSIQYYYELAGNGDGLLLLHGFTGSSQNWRPHTAVFSQHLQTLTLDILGHGRSASPANIEPYRMENVATDIIDLFDQLEIEQTHLLGYSMGGRLALYLALHYPHRFHSLILESASPGLETAVSRNERIDKDNALAKWIEEHGIEAFVNRWEQLPLWNSQQQLIDQQRLTLRQQRLQNNILGLANSLRGMGTGQQPNLWPKLSTLTLPTLLLAGEFDTKFVGINQKMVAQLPNAKLKMMANAGHTIHLEQPAPYQQTILQFLQEQTDGNNN